MSLSLPTWFGRIGGTYYWNPGSPTAPHVTVTRSYGMPGFGANAVFLRNGMTSQDTLGSGMSGNVSTGIPSISANGTIPDDGERIPRPWKSRVTSIEAGIGSPNASPAVTGTYTPDQIAEFPNKYIFGPAMGPQDELSPFARSLRSATATVAPSSEPPVRFIGSRGQTPLGDGRGGWSSSIDIADSRQPAAMQPESTAQRPGGLLGLMQDYVFDRYPTKH
jgi:hypothetical protein